MILDLTLTRMRQIVAAILERVKQEELVKRSYITWQTKNLALFISSTAMSVKGQKALLKLADELSMEPERKGKEPKPGSYERLRGILG